MPPSKKDIAETKRNEEQYWSERMDASIAKINADKRDPEPIKPLMLLLPFGIIAHIVKFLRRNKKVVDVGGDVHEYEKGLARKKD